MDNHAAAGFVAEYFRALHRYTLAADCSDLNRGLPSTGSKRRALKDSQPLAFAAGLATIAAMEEDQLVDGQPVRVS